MFGGIMLSESCKFRRPKTSNWTKCMVYTGHSCLIVRLLQKINTTELSRETQTLFQAPSHKTTSNETNGLPELSWTFKGKFQFLI